MGIYCMLQVYLHLKTPGTTIDIWIGMNFMQWWFCLLVLGEICSADIFSSSVLGCKIELNRKPFKPIRNYMYMHELLKVIIFGTI